MAKVKYQKNSLDPNKTYNFVSDSKYLQELLQELNIENCPLSVTINGKTPDNLSLDYELKKDDEIIIKKPVLGGQQDRKILGTVVQIAAIAVTIASGGALSPISKALIVTGAALISGALQKLGLRKPRTPETQEQQAARDAFSITAASNTARPLEPMNVVLGSHRLSPDFSSAPYSRYIDNPDQESVQSWLNLRLSQQANQFNATLPANWVSNNILNQYNYTSGFAALTTNWWPYPVRYDSSMSTSSFINDALYLNNTSLAGVNDYDYLFFTPLTPQNFDTTSGSIQGRSPFLIQHFDPNDPVVIANGGQPYVSTLEFLCWTYFSQLRYNNTNNTFFDEAHGSSVVVSNEFDRLYKYLIGVENRFFDPFQYDSFFEIVLSITPNYLGCSNLYRDKDMNGGDRSFFIQLNEDSEENNPSKRIDDDAITLLNQNNSSLIQRRNSLLDYVDSLQLTTPSLVGRFLFNYQVPVDPNLQEVRHIFHHGLGDLDIQDPRIKNTDITKLNGNEVITNTKTTTAWPLNSDYASNVKVVDGADLINNSQFSGPITSGDLTIGSNQNWITRQTPLNTTRIEINIEGNSFRTNDDGSYGLLAASFEIQFRDLADSVFTLQEATYILASNKPDPIRETYILSGLPSSQYEIRIRKITKDPEESREVQSFKISSFNFFVDDNASYVAENRQGVRLLATGFFNGQTDSYNNLVENYCYVKLGSFFSWQKTRNPAWLFYYFARGGFVNDNADGTDTYPLSPTVGWYNTIEADGNGERLFGAGFKESEIDLEKIEEWADFCDTNNLKCDLVLKQDTSAQEMLEQIANIGRASVTYYRGKLSVTIEDPLQMPVAMFGMSNIVKDSFSVSYNTKNLPFKLIGNYTNRDNDWQSDTVEAQVLGSNANESKITEISLNGITETARAQREINLAAARQLYQRRSYTWESSVEGIVVKRGDLVYLSHDLTMNEYSGRILEFIIEDNLVTKIKTSEILPDDTTNILIRLPNGQINNYNCSKDGAYLNITSTFNAENAPENLNNNTQNLESLYPRTHPEDYLFFAGPQPTLGKIVRIQSIEPSNDLVFKFNAVDEELAMYNSEFNLIPPQVTDNPKIVAKVFNVDWKQLENGQVEVFFELDGAIAAQIIDKSTGLPLMSVSGVTLFGNKGVFDLIPNQIYDVRIEPIVVGTDFESVTQDFKIKV